MEAHRCYPGIEQAEREKWILPPPPNQRKTLSPKQKGKEKEKEKEKKSDNSW